MWSVDQHLSLQLTIQPSNSSFPRYRTTITVTETTFNKHNCIDFDFQMAPTTRQSTRAGLVSIKDNLPASLNDTASDTVMESKDLHKSPEDYAMNETKQQSSNDVKQKVVEFKVAKLCVRVS